VRRPTTWTILAALVVSGCTARVGPPLAAGSSTTTTTTTTTTATTTTATTTTSAPLTAANGTDLTACGDADCEVLVNGQVEVPLAPAFECVRFAVGYFAPNRVAFNVDCVGSGHVTGYFLGRGALRLVNGITLEVDRIDGTGAVLHLIPRTTTDDPTRNQVNGEFGAAFT
jgi:hypothetical protein